MGGCVLLGRILDIQGMIVNEMVDMHLWEVIRSPMDTLEPLHKDEDESRT